MPFRAQESQARFAEWVEHVQSCLKQPANTKAAGNSRGGTSSSDKTS